jgi:hypothetical protein
MLRIPHCLDNRLIGGGKVVSPTHPPHFIILMFLVFISVRNIIVYETFIITSVTAVLLFYFTPMLHNKEGKKGEKEERIILYSPLVEALYYKLEGRGFDSRCRNFFFQLT